MIEIVITERDVLEWSPLRGLLFLKHEKNPQEKMLPEFENLGNANRYSVLLAYNIIGLSEGCIKCIHRVTALNVKKKYKWSFIIIT